MVAGLCTMYSFATEANRFGLVHRDMHINLKECHAVIQLLHQHKELLSGRALWLFVDNKVCVSCINKNWSGSYLLMDFVYEVSALLIDYRIALRVDYVPTEANLASDVLSRVVSLPMSMEERRSEFLSQCDPDGFFGFRFSDSANFDYYDSLRILQNPPAIPVWSRVISNRKERPIVPEVWKLLSNSN